MSDNLPHSRHAEDAQADDAPPTAAATDDVSSAAAAGQDEAEHPDTTAGHDEQG